MSPLLLMLLQAQPIPAANVGYDDFDLAKMPQEAIACGASEGEILVCGRHKEPERVTRDFSEKPVRAEKSLGGGWTGSVEGEQHAIGGGISAPAAMVRFKLKF